MARYVRRHRREHRPVPASLGHQLPAAVYVDGGVNVRAIPLLLEPHRKETSQTTMLAGDAPKDFVVMGSNPRRDPTAHAYIAKAPRTKEGYRECATEYLIARLGLLLPVRVARARLVVLPGSPDADRPDVRFMSRLFRRDDERLVHGVEIVGRCMDMDRLAVESELDREQTERSFYTVDTVGEILGDAFPAAKNELLWALGRMIGFDALIGANDRHAMNWGVIESVVGRRPPRFSPLFDTARGLLWNHTDESLAETTRTPGGRRQFLENYVRKSRALIAAPGGAAPTHLELVRYLAKNPEEIVARGVRSIVSAYDALAIRRVLHYGFGRLLSPLRLNLVFDIVAARHNALTALLGTR